MVITTTAVSSPPVLALAAMADLTTRRLNMVITSQENPKQTFPLTGTAARKLTPTALSE